MNWDEHPRMAVACTGCGTIYVAFERNDGEVQLLGNANRCRTCGEEEFQVLTDSILPSSAEDDDD